MANLTGRRQTRNISDLSPRKTRLERDFNPAAIRQLIETVEQDILIGGAELAARAFRSGLIDECHLFLIPVIVGGGKSSLPSNIRLALELKEERPFQNGIVYLHYQVT